MWEIGLVWRTDCFSWLQFSWILNEHWICPGTIHRFWWMPFYLSQSIHPQCKNDAEVFLGSMCLWLFPLSVICAAAVGRLEQNNLLWLTDREERNGRNHYFPVKISLKQRGVELCMLRGVFGPLINSRGPISPSKAFLIISPVEKAALNIEEMILQSTSVSA